MISLFHACCSTILSRTGCLVTKRPPIGHFYPSRKTSCKFPGVRTVDLELLLTRLGVRCYCSKKSGGSGAPRKPKAGPKSQMKNDKEAFFVVRKGDLIGVYKSLKDCQAQVGTSICDPPISVYKGSSMPKETEKYLVSSGLKNALYSIRASDLTEDLFGTLVACPVQLPSVKSETSNEPVSKKRSHDALSSDYERFCTLEFDGASKGNPGQAGAGAILRSVDGSFVCRMREGLGIATCNVAEYRAFILGLKYALRKGFTSVQVRGDSKLVCMQIEGLWKVRNPNIATWYEEAKNLKDRFVNFKITHVLRDLNSEADVQANLGVDLPEGHVQEEIDK